MVTAEAPLSTRPTYLQCWARGPGPSAIWCEHKCWRHQVQVVSHCPSKLFGISTSKPLAHRIFPGSPSKSPQTTYGIDIPALFSSAITNLFPSPANRQPRAGSHLSSMDDCLGECLARFIFQCVWALSVVKIGNHIARHQNLIIRRILQLQDLFRMPKCIRVFSEDDHEIPETDIKVCAGIIVCCFALSAPLIVGMLLSWRSWWGMTLRLILVLAAVNSPFCILLWIILAVSSRRRESFRRRRAAPAARPCQETKEDEEIAKPARDGIATALATSRSTPDQQPLHWEFDELFMPFY